MHCDLNKYSPSSKGNLLQNLAHLPQGVTSLDLSWHHLDEKTEAELHQLVTLLPRALTALNLSFSYLFRQPHAIVASVLHALPPHITTLDLSCTDLLKSGRYILQVFPLISPAAGHGRSKTEACSPW